LMPAAIIYLIAGNLCVRLLFRIIDY